MNERPPLYNPDHEHDACGSGFIASIDGERSHRVIDLALQAVGNLSHRGAVSADAASGDGAGVTIQLPRELLADEATALGLDASDLDRLGVAMVFLPADPAVRDRARNLLTAVVLRAGIEVLGWRTVPTDPSTLGGLALDSLPAIQQLLLARGPEQSAEDFDRALYLARRRTEAEYRNGDVAAYIVSMSAHTVVYKGLMLATELSRFYPDLADARTVSSLALFHQRFATNTMPLWQTAQPFRRVAHNGEINTLLGNRNWMAARQNDMASSAWGDDAADLVPIISQTGSDTAALDEVLDLLIASGGEMLETMAMLIPEAWENMPRMDRRLRAFYQYHACLTEPWDGPAAVVFTDGRTAAAAMDRNGLRPVRYKVTTDGLVVLGSEVGMIELPAEEVVRSGRVGPGEMVAVDTVSGRFLVNSEIKEDLATRRPYGEWVTGVKRLPRTVPALDAVDLGSPQPHGAELETLQVLHGYTREELAQVLEPMALGGKEPIGSMGDDTALTALGQSSRPLYAYFRQRFAQVTNPAIDSLRERVVMSLDTYLGSRGSLFERTPEAAELVHLPSPILFDEELARIRAGHEGLRGTTLSAVFPAAGGPESMSTALDTLCAAAEAAVAEGHDVLIISDRDVGAEAAPIPMLLAVSAVHHRLIRAGCRMRVSLVAEAGDARDVHHVAALVGFGASAVNPWLALDTCRALDSVAASVEADDLDADASRGTEAAFEAARSYVRALEAGLLKIMAKMGIATVSSYHGAQIFEALGIGPEVIDRCFPGTTSRIGGAGLEDLAADVLLRHQRAYGAEGLDRGGWYKYRRKAEYHANEPPVWRALQKVAQGGGAEEYRTYANLVHDRPPTALRDLLRVVPDRDAIDIERAEPVSAIVRRFQTGAMSLGALSAEAHEDIARAMNQLGGLSNTGEGGEDPQRYSSHGGRRDANSTVKQVASGRFGVTAAYLAGADELEIKISQGSKPGEGGQLPGGKVSGYIATLRHVEPGTPLISPPPHHDIYSIEDIAQLIFDLRVVNPRARVCVKLVSAEGIGTIAAGVAKAYADVIHISGADGGTGASPLSSIKYAGDPWELGLAETQQTLTMNGLRDRVTLTTDGGLHTGRDVVKAALLGAERYGFGTAALIAIGCKMARQCHSNTCPVGIATQAEDLRKKYFGTPEMLIEFFTQLAGEVREILAWLGYERLDDVIGRADLLEQIESPEGVRWGGLDLSSLTVAPGVGPRAASGARVERPTAALDTRIIADAVPFVHTGESFQRAYPIRNTDRTVCGGLSGVVAKARGDEGLPEGSIDLTFTGSAGQSFGAWLACGLDVKLVGEANDYVGKGMGGGVIAIRPPEGSRVEQRESMLVGNTVLYGATGGSLFVAGRAGERFAVRNSGAVAVVEGIGQHGCEYMTGGTVVVLGETGRNFGAGMSGGRAFVLDRQGDFPSRVNLELVTPEPLVDGPDTALLRSLVEQHHQRTGSHFARDILRDWQRALAMFWQVVPKAQVATPRAAVRPGRRRRTGAIAPVNPRVAATLP